MLLYVIRRISHSLNVEFVEYSMYIIIYYLDRKMTKCELLSFFLRNICEVYIKIKIWKYEVIVSKNTKGNKSGYPELNHLFVFSGYDYYIQAILKKLLQTLTCIFGFCNRL